MIVRRDKLRASKSMAQKVLNHPKISLIWDSSVLEARGNDTFIQSLILKNNKTKDIQELKVSGLFYAIGHQPNTEFLKDASGKYQVDVNTGGYIQVEPGTSRTSVDGVFACGDVQDKRYQYCPFWSAVHFILNNSYRYRQAITAAGSGCMAALDCERWLEMHQ